MNPFERFDDEIIEPAKVEIRHETEFGIIKYEGGIETFRCLSGRVEVSYGRICIYGYLSHEDMNHGLLLVLREGDGIKLIK